MTDEKPIFKKSSVCTGRILEDVGREIRMKNQFLKNHPYVQEEFLRMWGGKYG
ncbi:MAG: hypothetical protein K6G63_06690 [Eubacterium sp.]|nr:hypothetical protein [Eubacterium sp.]